MKANRGAAGVDHVTVAMYEARLDANLASIGGSAARRDVSSAGDSPGTGFRNRGREQRPLGIPTVRDRVVQTALRYVLEPIFDGLCRRTATAFGRGGREDALRRVDALLQAGYRDVVDADLQSYFDTIPHAPLLARVAAKVAMGGCWR